MNPNLIRLCTAFEGTKHIASGYLWQVASQVQTKNIRFNLEPVLIFDDLTGEVIDLDPRDLAADAASHTEPILADEPARKPGRPKLGVVAREVTLLPRHWDWLATQPGGASVAMRKLVEEARRTHKDKDQQRAAQAAAYRFISTMAGSEPGFEETARALFAGDRESFAKLVELWPIDVGSHAKKLADRAFEFSWADPSSKPKPCYTLEELLAKSDSSQPMPAEDRERINAPPVGRELL
jgi:uncharacterized protein